MQNGSKFCFFFIALIGLLSINIAAGQAKPVPKTARNSVSASGCVEAGVEAGCIVLKDTRSGTLYNMFFKSNPPEINTAIHFVGRKHDGPTTCMQGTPVDVRSFTKLKMHCPASPANEKK